MSQTRMTTVTCFALALQMAGQPGWSQSDARATAQVPVYMCQFGDTAHVYAFHQTPDGWEGVGELKGWSVTEQNGGLVARNATDTIMLGAGSASLLQDGRLVQGNCADATAEMAQLFQSDDMAQAVPGDADSQNPRVIPDPSADPSAALPRGVDPDMLSALDPQNWDSAKVATIIDALNLDNSAKSSMQAELRAANRDPVRIARLVRQIEQAFGIDAAATDDLRAKLRDARQQLDSVNQAFDEQRKRLKETSAQLTNAVAQANAAERANAALSAQVTAAQKAAATAQRDLASVQRDLAAAAAKYESLRVSFSATLIQLTAARDDLATANKRIIKLGGVPVRQ